MIRNHEECHCKCHIDESVMLCMPCCGRCPHCNVFIKNLYIENHIKECEQHIQDIMRELSEIQVKP